LISEIRNLLSRANIAGLQDIVGEGRIEGIRKPTVVASRTRQGLKNMAKVDIDGTIPKRKLPKYDFNGDLAWYIDTISASRPSDDDLYGVEFKATLSRSGEESAYPRVSEGQSWESVGVLKYVLL